MYNSYFTKNHYLKKFKSVLDKIYGKAPLHVCLEAAHPDTLGRSSDLVMKIVQTTQFEEHGSGSEDRIITHYIPDRLSVPELKGHVLVIGGPSSNVVSRIVMEYEKATNTFGRLYRRHTNYLFPLDYIHVHRDDYNGRLYADMDTLDKTARAIIHHYYSIINAPAVDNSIQLFSVNRFLRWKNDFKLPSLSAAVNPELVDINYNPTSDTNDFQLYDHFVETIMPNVLLKKSKKRAIIIYHGLRSLGTFSALLKLSDDQFLDGFEQRLLASHEAAGHL